MNCDEHFVYVASVPGEPGAYGSCVCDPRWLPEFAAEAMEMGATLRKVSCNEAHKLLMEFVAWRDNQLDMNHGGQS